MIRVPVMLYDVCRGEGPEDLGVVILCTARTEPVAQALVRHLERARAAGDVDIGGACFVRPVESAVTAQSPGAAQRDGYTLRYELAALPEEPLAREVAPATKPRPQDEEPGLGAIEDPEHAAAAPQGRP